MSILEKVVHELQRTSDVVLFFFYFFFMIPFRLFLFFRRVLI